MLDWASVVYAQSQVPMRRNIVVGLLVSLCGCANSGEPFTPQAQVYHVLFIGNSLTYTNDLPRTVSQLASTAGDSIVVESVALPNLALIDHVNGQSNAVEVIRGGRWDYVVLQQGPSSLPVSRDTLILATKLLDPDIRTSGGRTAELMVWPAKENFAGFDQVRTSYQDAALAVGGLFLPAGEAWRTAWATDPSLQLYGDDDYHPSELGSLLAAFVVYEGITGRDAQTLPGIGFADGRRVDVSTGIIRALQRAAHET